MSDAFRQYPFHISVVYNSPVQYGPANAVYPAKTNYKATMWGIPYDDLDGLARPVSAGSVCAQFEKMAAGWRSGIAELQLAAEKARPNRRHDAEADLRVARAGAIIFNRSPTRRALSLPAMPWQNPPSATARTSVITFRLKSNGDWNPISTWPANSFPLVREDSRIGFDPSCQYFYLPLDLVEKVVNCRWVLGHVEE